MLPHVYHALPRPPTALPGSLGCATRVAGLVAYGLDQARIERGRSREDVAARMSAAQAQLVEQIEHYPLVDHDDGIDCLEILWKIATGSAATAIAQMASIQASVAGALAASVPVSETGARLVAAVDAVGARAEIGAASVADVQAALPAGLTYRLDQLNRLTAMGAVGNKL